MSSLHVNINLTFQQLVEVVKQLSPAEKMKLSEVIWTEENSIPVEQQELVLNRINKAKKDPSRMLDWDQASNTLNS